MLKRLACLVALLTPGAALAQTPEPARPIEVMILASPHMADFGRDIHNARVDPVTTPRRQAELAALVEALAEFGPTAVAVERVAGTDSLLDPIYPRFTPEDLARDGDERVQIAYRLAHRLGLTRVYAIDEQAGEGEPSYFPYDKVVDWAEANGRLDQLAALQAEAGAMVGELEGRQRTLPVADLLAWVNDPLEIRRAHGLYSGLLAFGAGEDQPGAVLNGRWYARNAVIVARLLQVARPGDRIVVVFGAGHAWWLRQIAGATPGVVVVEPEGFLGSGAPQAADGASRSGRAPSA